MFNFYLISELEKIGFGSFGKKIIIKKSVQFYNPSKIHIGNNVIIDDYSLLSAEKEIVIKDNVHISSFCALYGRHGIIMENYAALSNRVTLYTESDDYSGDSLTNPTIPLQFRPKYILGSIHLKAHVIVGTNSTILPNVTVGEGSAIGSHTLVTRNLDPWTIYFGIPAKKVKSRSKNLLLLASQFEEMQSKATSASQENEII